ncbi:MAG: cobalamin biosynthesis protein, partial [Lachnospiraceae bacterium]|nr:cobalamin biosynthesis protein [Lachnospiraceae bacterium]
EAESVSSGDRIEDVACDASGERSEDGVYDASGVRNEDDVCAVPDMKKEEASIVESSLRDWCADVFAQSSALIFVGATGIAVRTIAPFLVSKAEDPAVLVADEQGKHVISLLSGHLGGGNELTIFLAESLGADPVITTASDVGGKLAIDVWAQKNGLYITDLKAAKAVAARIVGGMSVLFYCEGCVTGEIPPELVRADPVKREKEPVQSESVKKEPELVQSESVKREDEHVQTPEVRDENTGLRDGKCLTGAETVSGKSAAGRSSLPVAADCLVIVSVSEPDALQRLKRDRVILHLVPRAVILGIGCKKGKSAREIHDFVFDILNRQRLAPQSIAAVASIDLKSGEAGLLDLAAELGVPFLTFSAEELRAVPGDYSSSGFANRVTGVDNVCERAAMAALTEEEQKKAHFLCRKTVGGGMTAALLEKEWKVTF